MGFDFVCCADCGHMIRKDRLLIHEAWSCAALPLSDDVPDLTDNSQNSVDSNSVGSDDSDIRQRRKEARFAASVAQARAVGMVEEGQKVDFTFAPYASVTPPAPLVSKEGNVYNNKDTQCVQDYTASARAIGMIEDCVFDDLTTPPSDVIPLSTYLKLGGAVAVWSLVGGAMSWMEGLSVAEGVMQNVATASLAGCVIAAGNAMLSPSY